MIYILFGEEATLIKDKINSIISKNKDALITKIDASNIDYNVDNIVEACKSIGLFNDTSLVLVKDPYFLCKKVEDKNFGSLLEYCKNPLYEANLIFYTLDNLFNEKLTIFKNIAANAEIIKLNQLQRNEFINYAKNTINSLKLNITKEAVDYLINNVNLSITLLNQNLEVLSLYPEKIDLDCVKKLITFPNIDDVFCLINALTARQISKSINYANKLLESDQSILRLISSLASQLRFLYSVGYYRSIGNTSKEIMSILNIKSSFRLDKAIESLTKVNTQEIEDLLSKLSDLEYSLKKNDDIDEKLKLELFIVGLLK